MLEGEASWRAREDYPLQSGRRFWVLAPRRLRLEQMGHTLHCGVVTDFLDIECAASLLEYLRRTARIGEKEEPLFEVLAGGVSNRTVRVTRLNGESWVIKQALAKLRVKADWFSDPARVHREALGLRGLKELAPPDAVPAFIFEDHTHHLLAMQAVPVPHENWKTLLLAGQLDFAHVTQFGQILGTIHRSAAERRAEIELALADRSFFDTLRLEPYYRFTAGRQPEAAPFFDNLIADTLASRITLVHGDYSPKNILICQDRLILLDHEVIHWGDPAFDLGFSLTHLLSKAHHLPAKRAAFLDAARHYWNEYRRIAGELALLPGLEGRAVRHTLGCLLARVDGRSPLEYLTDDERNRQRALVLGLLRSPPERLTELFGVFGETLGR